MMDILTDNRNRTAAEIRHIFSRRGGSLGETGCVSWMFKRKGYLTVAKEGIDEDELMLLALEAGVSDFENSEDIYEIYTEPEDFEQVKGELEKQDIKFLAAEITMIPTTTVSSNER